MDIYQQTILDYYKHPSCQGCLSGATKQAEAVNPLCGDSLTIYLAVAGTKITKATWQGEGCVLSLAAADMLAQYLTGKTLSEAKKINKAWMLTTLGINPSPSRLKCALLPLEALSKLLTN
jgi:nitrogen fixation NifU-like protein